MVEENITSLVAAIDTEIREYPWFDFHLISYTNSKLTIAGGVNLSYYHTLEIAFQDVFFFSGFLQGWRSNTKSTVFMIPDNAQELNYKFEIEDGYQLFVFNTEDYQQDVIIAAKRVNYNKETVYYYDKPNLKDGERLADFVKVNQSK